MNGIQEERNNQKHALNAEALIGILQERTKRKRERNNGNGNEVWKSIYKGILLIGG